MYIILNWQFCLYNQISAKYSNYENKVFFFLMERGLVYLKTWCGDIMLAVFYAVDLLSYPVTSAQTTSLS